MDEIKELDNKYLVLKWDDINEILDGQDLVMLNHFLNQIRLFRKHKGKKDNRYVVLNLDDEIDVDYLLDTIKLVRKTDQQKSFKEYLEQTKGVKDIEQRRRPHEFMVTLKVKDIAVDLVNAILKAKEK